VKRVLPAIPESPRQVFANYAFEQRWVPGSGSALFAAEPALKVEICEQAWQLWRDTLGDDHLYTLNSAHELALLLRALGEYERARDVDEDTLARFRRVLGDDHPHTLISASNLASDLRALAEWERARELDQDTLTRFRRVFGEDDPNTLISANNSLVTCTC
jgi:Tetratricopeptide repeat